MSVSALLADFVVEDYCCLMVTGGISMLLLIFKWIY